MGTQRRRYDVRVLDRLVARVAREIRLLDQALKATNARTIVPDASILPSANAVQLSVSTGPIDGIDKYSRRRRS
jgi:hypothetical protein